MRRGAESLDPDACREAGKQVDADRLTEVVAACRKHGIRLIVLPPVEVQATESEFRRCVHEVDSRAGRDARSGIQDGAIRTVTRHDDRADEGGLGGGLLGRLRAVKGRRLAQR